MPRIIDCPTEESIDLETLVDLLETTGLDPRDEEEFASWGAALKKLGNNRTFLADLMMAELKQRCEEQVRHNQYSAQVIMLHTSSQRYFLRANLWPAEADTVVRQSGTDPFFYGVPHDHNFSFLTVGYLGPGYWSDYYEFDYDRVIGYPGEKVDLRFVEKARLEPGKVMLYRAHRDVHLQLPADSLSVSLNIVEQSHSITFRDQYRFDVENSTVAGIMTRSSLEPMLMLAAHHGGGNGIDLLDTFALSHPSDRVRWAALRARAGAAQSIAERIAILERGTRDPNRLVVEMARTAVAKLTEGRAWIEAPPLLEVAA
jgi:hypothetical protein